MQNQALIQLRIELGHFIVICYLNIVFAALAMAFGTSYLLTAIFGQTAGLAPPLFRILIGMVSLISVGLGIQWLLSTLRIFGGVEEINDNLDAEGTAITGERITCLIVQMLAHYRNNRTTIDRMILVCTLGGICFFGLGIASSLEAFIITAEGISLTLDNLLVIPAMLLTLGIAFASLLSSAYFRKFSTTWDQRLREIDESECALKQKLELDEQ